MLFTYLIARPERMPRLLVPVSSESPRICECGHFDKWVRKDPFLIAQLFHPPWS